MRAAGDIAVTGLGAVTPVGLSAPASCAALRAGIARMKSLETLKVESEAFAMVSVVGGRAPTEWFEGGPVKDWEWPGHERFEVEPPPRPEALVAPDETRLIELAVPAAREAWGRYGEEVGPTARVALYLGLPEDEPAQPILDAIQGDLGFAFSEATPFRDGRASALVALGAAVSDLAEGRATAALVGGVDSLIRNPVLRRLSARRVLRTRARPDGVIPGEGAAFVLLETVAAARAHSAEPSARILSTGFAEEPSAQTEDPNQALGLTRALRDAVRDAGGLETLPLTICDLNGDRYRAMEWAMASTRVLGSVHGEVNLRHPADCIGDCGAASGTLNVVWAANAFLKGYARSDRALVWGASDGPARAAALFAPGAKPEEV